MVIRRNTIALILFHFFGFNLYGLVVPISEDWLLVPHITWNTTKNPSQDLLTAWQNSLQNLQDDTTSTDDDSDDPHVTTIISDPDDDYGHPTVNDDIYNPNDVLISSQNIDTDDDVPMLTNIYERLDELDKDSSQYKDYDSNTLAEIWETLKDTRGTIQEYNATETKQTQLADLENSLRRLEIQMRDSRGQYLDANGSPTGEYASLADVVNAINNREESNASMDINSDAEDIQDDITDKLIDGENSLVSKLSKPINYTPNQSDLLSRTIEFNLKGDDYYWNPFDPSTHSANLSSYFSNIPSLTDVGLFVKRCLIVVIMIWYYRANYKIILDSMHTVTIMPESAPVSNYSIFGINLAGAGLKVFKTSLVAAFFGTIIFTTYISMAELQISFGLGDATDATGSATSIIDSVINSIAGMYEWTNSAINLLYIFIPIGTISSAVFTVYTNKIVLSAQILAFNRAQKTAS